MLIFARDSDPRIRQVALLSLMKVFNDILPVSVYMFTHEKNYPIHLASKEEKEGQISKDVRKMRQYEESLMTFYQVNHYIEFNTRVILKYLSRWVRINLIRWRRNDCYQSVVYVEFLRIIINLIWQRPSANQLFRSSHHRILNHSFWRLEMKP